MALLEWVMPLQFAHINKKNKNKIRHFIAILVKNIKIDEEITIKKIEK